MKLNKSWTTIIEAIVVMLIVTVWIIGASSIYQKSQNLANTTKNRLIAIDIAREWIEAVTNIRDTNWTLFVANTDYCWNTKDYNANCITSNLQTNNIAIWSYIITRNTDNRWILTSRTTWSYSNSTYRNNFRVRKDTNWFYTQSTWTNFKPEFTREIKITYPWPSNINPRIKMKVESIVSWADSSKKTHHTLTLETELTNWLK